MLGPEGFGHSQHRCSSPVVAPHSGLATSGPDGSTPASLAQLVAWQKQLEANDKALQAMLPAGLATISGPDGTPMSIAQFVAAQLVEQMEENNKALKAMLEDSRKVLW